MRLLSAFFALIPIISACGGAQDDPAPTDTASEDALIYGGSTYYVAEPDTRRCPSPLCGGYWVSRVNRSTTYCADGTRADSCYVATLDLGSLGLSRSQRNSIVTSIGSSMQSTRVVFRAKLEERQYGRNGQLGDLVVSEAWMAPHETSLDGVFYKLGASGSRCCEPYLASPLNGTRRTVVASLNFADSPGSSSDQNDAMDEVSTRLGLIAVGYPESGYSGTEMHVEQYFTLVR